MTFFNPLWDLLVSYNFLQVAILGPRKIETNYEYVNFAKPFFEMLERYYPDILIVWGIHLPNEH